jgi:hypothetical protein
MGPKVGESRGGTHTQKVSRTSRGASPAASVWQQSGGDVQWDLG